jgi:hypothetical protein
MSSSATCCGTTIGCGFPSRNSLTGTVSWRHNLRVLLLEKGCPLPPDGNLLIRSSRANPSLIIYAWALRVAERLENSL